ncbi:conserved exported hypothetical protein [uncultured Eubacteriales bacterium]|uniref:Uncharacterized protein n=1 Tax=uncultured Eubacteriales bacterium TaxID=172733 RepID=A0A212K5N3_9FIRM|nr:conserved exported hypothetical protein [uncultured Eubacteriales bacterium]
MKKTAAVLGILCLLLLSGCVKEPPGGSEPSPPVQTTGTSPTESPTPPETSQPQDTDEPNNTPPPGETNPPAGFLSAEELSALAAQWCDDYADRFSNYETVRIGRGYWFAEYTGAAGTVTFTASDGLDGAVYFLPDDGVLGPDGAAAQMLGQEAGHLILVDRARAVEELSQRMAAMAGENLTKETALDAFLKSAQYTPALLEDMWYCVNVDDTGYILMAYNGAYRLQRMAAMPDYAASPEFQVRIAFDEAATAYSWLRRAPLPLDRGTTADLGDGRSWYRVDYPGISSMLELRTYLKNLFSDEIVDALLGEGSYADVDGVLYAYEFSNDLPAPEGQGTVVRESATKVIYHLNTDCVYEKVGDRWLFTEFSLTA